MSSKMWTLSIPLLIILIIALVIPLPPAICSERSSSELSDRRQPEPGTNAPRGNAHMGLQRLSAREPQFSAWPAHPSRVTGRLRRAGRCVALPGLLGRSRPADADNRLQRFFQGWRGDDDRVLRQRVRIPAACDSRASGLHADRAWPPQSWIHHEQCARHPDARSRDRQHDRAYDCNEGHRPANTISAGGTAGVGSDGGVTPHVKGRRMN